MLFLAQGLKISSLLANDAYANIAAINAAAAAVDISTFRKEQSLIVVFNEDAGANTTIAVEHSDVSGSDFAAVPADALTNPVTGAATTLANLNTAGIKTIAVDLSKLRRYVRIQAATELGAASAVAAALVGSYENTPES